MQTDDLATILRNNGYSLTRPRKLIFETLLDTKPKSITELINTLSVKTDRASIYRTVDLFEKLGIAHRINTGWKYKIELSDMFIGHHHHMHCRRCDKIDTMRSNPILETMIDKAASNAGFSPTYHQMEVYGICSRCK
jgi:Fe2+ or Zn2+ uptake regulation protein